MRSRRVIAAASVRVRGAIVQVVLAQVAVLDLQGGVVDAELVVEVVHQCVDEGVVSSPGERTRCAVIAISPAPSAQM